MRCTKVIVTSDGEKHSYIVPGYGVAAKQSEIEMGKQEGHKTSVRLEPVIMSKAEYDRRGLCSVY